MIFVCVLSVLVVGETFGLPSRRGFYSMDASPSGYMFGGYYKNPTSIQDYLPSMSAVVTKDVVATNTFAGLPQDPAWNTRDPAWNNRDPGWNTDSKEDYTEKIPVAQDVPGKTPEISIEESASGENSFNGNEKPNKSNRKGRKPYRPQEEDDDTPWWLARGGNPSFTSFFPININGGGGGGGSRRRSGSTSSGGPQDDGDVPYSPSGSATAIANSFSTGRGGVATSHATSFGDPYLAAMFLRNGMHNLRGQGQRPGATY